MNDQNQPQNQQPDQASVAPQPVTQPVVAQPQQQVTPPPPVSAQVPQAPVSVPNKEHVPVANETLPVQEFVQSADQEPKLPAEVKEAGVQAKHEAPALTDDHKKVGVFHAPEIMPAVQSFTPTVNFILSPEEEKIALKKSSRYSMRWLAELQKKVREQIFGKTIKAKESA